MDALSERKPLIHPDLVWAGVSFMLAGVAFFEYARSGSAWYAAFALLDVQAGYLFWVRHPEAAAVAPGGRESHPVRLENRLPDIVAVAAMISPFLYDFDARTGLHPLAASLSAAGIAGIFVSVWSLGAAFGVMPRYRAIRTTGAYRVLRHPIYASLVVLQAGLVAANPVPENVAVFVAALGFAVQRIRFEERLLGRVGAYREYSEKVRYRLLPGVW